MKKETDTFQANVFEFQIKSTAVTLTIEIIMKSTGLRSWKTQLNIWHTHNNGFAIWWLTEAIQQYEY